MWRVLFLPIISNSAYSHTRSQSLNSYSIFSMTHTDLQDYVGQTNKPTKLCSLNTLFYLIRFTTKLWQSSVDSHTCHIPLPWESPCNPLNKLSLENPRCNYINDSNQWKPISPTTEQSKTCLVRSMKLTNWRCPKLRTHFLKRKGYIQSDWMFPN